MPRPEHLFHVLRPHWHGMCAYHLSKIHTEIGFHIGKRRRRISRISVDKVVCPLIAIVNFPCQIVTQDCAQQIRISQFLRWWRDQIDIMAREIRLADEFDELFVVQVRDKQVCHLPNDDSQGYSAPRIVSMRQHIRFHHQQIHHPSRSPR